MFLKRHQTNKSLELVGSLIGEDDSCDVQELQEPDYLTVSYEDERICKSTIVFGVLFFVVVLFVFSGISKNVPEKASANSIDLDEARIEVALIKFSGAGSDAFRELDTMVNKFQVAMNIEQVKIDELVKNPFRPDLSGFSYGGGAGYSGSGMQLITIMESELGNCCMIDDKLLYAGDTINGFTIVEITDNIVRLKDKGGEMVLRMPE